MKQRMGIRIFFHRLIKGFVDKRVIITLTQHIGNNASVAKVEDGTQIKFMRLKSLIPFEFSYIGKPFLIRPCSVKLTVQNILGNILRVLACLVQPWLLYFTVDRISLARQMRSTLLAFT